MTSTLRKPRASQTSINRGHHPHFVFTCSSWHLKKEHVEQLTALWSSKKQHNASDSYLKYFTSRGLRSFPANTQFQPNFWAFAVGSVKSSPGSPLLSHLKEHVRLFSVSHEAIFLWVLSTFRLLVSFSCSVFQLFLRPFFFFFFFSDLSAVSVDPATFGLLLTQETVAIQISFATLSMTSSNFSLSWPSSLLPNSFSPLTSISKVMEKEKRIDTLIFRLEIFGIIHFRITRTHSS